MKDKRHGPRAEISSPTKSSALDAIKHLAPARRLGWAFLLAWVFCVFYTDTAGGISGYAAGASLASQQLAARLYHASFPLLVAVMTFAFVVAFERRMASSLPKPRVAFAASAMCAAGTPLVLISTPGASAMAALLFGCGAVLTGIGSGLLWILWGGLYCALNRDEVEALAPASGVIAVALVLLVAATSGWVGLAMVASFPLICAASLVASRRGLAEATDFDPTVARSAHERAAETPLASLRRMGRANIGIFACCAVVCVIGSDDRASLLPIALDLGLLLGALLIVVVALAATARPRRISAAFLLRWMCPLLLVGLGCAIWFPDGTGGGIALAVSLASRLMFCVFTQMYFALLATAGRLSPTQSFGLGWTAVHLGDLVGVVLVQVVGAWAGEGALLGAGGVTAMMAALTAIVMFVLGRADSDAFATPPTAFEAASAGLAPLEGAAQGLGASGEAPGVPTPASAPADRVGEAPQASRASAPQAAPAAGARRVAGTASKGHGLAESTMAPPTREAIVARLAANHSLTKREAQVLNLLAQGRSVPYIRDALVISKDTVATHVKHIYAKLGVHTRQELLDLFE